MVGDSIVFRASTGAPHGPFGTLSWRGIRGAKISSLVPSIRSLLKHEPAPSIIIVHVGTNDIFTTPVKEIRGRIEEGLCNIRQLLPNTIIIWSDILLRLFYYGESRSGVGKKNVYALNRHAHRLCRRLGRAHAIVHSHNINPSQVSMYWRDGLHLSSLGNKAFCENLCSALAFFESNPEALLFPPVTDRP